MQRITQVWTSLKNAIVVQKDVIVLRYEWFTFCNLPYTASFLFIFGHFEQLKF